MKKQTQSWPGFHKLSRRKFMGTTAGAAGVLLGSALELPAFANDNHKCKALARPIPHITGPGHFFFPGPPDGSAPPSFPHFPNAGFDPSTVTDFKGEIGQADLNFSGMGTDLNNGHTALYGFHTDWRFMKGVFVAIDGLQHKGTLTFI